MAGREDGLKDRPCVIVVAVEMRGPNVTVVTVVPITHSPPSDPAVSMELPHPTKRRLGLDDLPSWIILNEANQFRWRGPDVKPIDGQSGTPVYGGLPYQFVAQLRLAFTACQREKRSIIPRTE